MNKNEVVAGDIYTVRNDRPLVNGLIGGLMGNNATVTHLYGRNPFDDPNMDNFILQAGDQVEVVHGPKRKNNLNVVCVKQLATGLVGYVFWCEYKANFVPNGVVSAPKFSF